MNLKKLLNYKLLGIALLFIIWFITSILVNLEIIIPSPSSTIKKIFYIFSNNQFLFDIYSTIMRGIIGFVLSLFIGLIFGFFAGLSKTFRDIIHPFLVVIKSTPVMSFILIALIWFDTNFVPMFVALLMTLPIIIINITQGILNINQEYIELSQVFKLNKRQKILKIYFPSISPYIFASLKTSIGLTWKVIIAAEVLAQPAKSIGTNLQFSKANLETAEVFAWTIIAILISYITELIILYFEKKLNWRIKSWK